MPTRQLTTEVTFLENCEYLSSTITRKLEVPQTEVTVTLTLDNLTHTTGGKNYFTDVLRCTAYVTIKNTTTPVQTGRIEFYYKPANSSVVQPLNQETNNQLNNQGITIIDIKPKTAGDIIAVYKDDNQNYVHLDEAKISTELRDIPTKIYFTKAPPFLTNVDDEVKLEVKVIDVLGQPVSYGVVTFLHYIERNEDINDPNKRIERVIGNPVLVEDGIAKIKYIPVQTDSDLEPESLDINGETRYVEYIRAVYNYDNDLYGLKWRYYAQSSAWTSVALYKRNSITIGIKNCNTNADLTYQKNESDTVVIQSILKDKDGNNIILTKDDNIDITFHIEGTHKHPTKNPRPDVLDEFSYIEYKKKDVKVNKNNVNNGIYPITLPKLLPGNYTIYASTNYQNTITDSENNKVTYIDGNTPKEGEILNNQYYDKIENSNVILLTINYDAENYNITASGAQTFKINNLITTKGIINNLSNKSLNILNDQPCYFHIPKLNKTYPGTLTKQENTLVGTVNGNIMTIPISGLYDLYMYIWGGIYSKHLTETAYHDSSYDTYIDYKPTKLCTLTITENITADDINLSVNYNPDNNVPCTVNYNLNVQGITNQTTIRLSYYPVNNPTNITQIGDIVLSKNSPSQSGIVSNNLSSGNYILEAKALDTNATKTVNIQIQAGTIEQSLSESSKKVEFGIDKEIIVSLSSTNDISYLVNSDKLYAYIQKDSTTNMYIDDNEVIIRDIQKINNNNLNLFIKTNAHLIGDYYISIYYKGDSNIKETKCTPEKFTTFGYEPQAQLIPWNNTYDIQITHDNGNGLSSKTTNTALILPVVFAVNNHTQVGHGVLITDGTGYGCIYSDYEDITQESWWNSWNTIAIIFNPYQQSYIDIVKNNPNNLYNSFKANADHVFDVYDLCGTGAQYYDIKAQLIRYEYKYLFDTYKSSQIILSRPNI